jgi:hypothetical protein
MRSGIPLLIASGFGLGFGGWSATAAEKALTFEKDIRPILKAHCFHCHGEGGETKSGLDVRLRRFLEKGGESGPAIVPGDAAKSHLLEMVRSGKMPKEKPRLKDKDIATLEMWIAQGAPTARPEPEKLGPEHAFTDEERAWWSLQPVKKPAVPGADNGTHAIDAFIAARLSENGLGFSPEADPVTLIRRAAFDLTGLPPTPEEVAVFLAEWKDGERAYERLIERLLASPAYGEKWGRHWLDVAGYADSDGFNEKDVERKHAHKYRDYVVRSLNGDKPFDAFVREQLAGDELAKVEGLTADAPGTEGRARYEELLTATGFLRMAPDGTGVQNDIAARNACISATLKIVGTAFYGLTVGCAECHDHRYDPITQADYYRLRAIFDPGFDPLAWRIPANRLVSLQTKESKAEAEKVEAEARKLDLARVAKQTLFIDEVLEKELLKRDEAIRDTLRTAYKTELKKRTPEQTKLLKEHPSVNSLSAASLYLYDTTYKTQHAAELKKMLEEATAFRAKKPVEEFVQAFVETPKMPDKVAPTPIFYRGDPESPKEAVSPGELSVLAGWRQIEVPADDPALPTTGRRLAFARSLTDGQHPLLARVIVNRMWMHHFGKGLVASAGDFGALGEKPSHPELLDWLAAEFVASGWSLKSLHRTILTSRTWRQQSRRDAERDRIDPDNRLLSRQNVRRLEAETLRDSLLAVSGKLNAAIGGAPVPVMYNEEGQVVVGVDTTDDAGRPSGKFVSLNGEEFRRSVYVKARRTRPLEMFAAFDAPSMTEANCEVRPVTTVSPQSLLLMNNTVIREYAQHFAERLQAECCTDAAAQVERAWRLCYGEPPVAEDARAAVEFVVAQTEHYRANPAKLDKAAGPAEKENAAPELMGLAAFCHALMSANGFLYVD